MSVRLLDSRLNRSRLLTPNHVLHLLMAPKRKHQQVLRQVLAHVMKKRPCLKQSIK